MMWRTRRREREEQARASRERLREIQTDLYRPRPPITWVYKQEEDGDAMGNGALPADEADDARADRLATLERIARAVAGNYDYNMARDGGWYVCDFCHAQEMIEALQRGYGALTHDPDCIVLAARALFPDAPATE